MDPGDGRGNDRMHLQVRIAARESDALKDAGNFWFSGDDIGENGTGLAPSRVPGERIYRDRTCQEPV